MSLSKITQNVQGAPVSIGQRVTITNIVDINTFDYIGMADEDSIEDAIEKHFLNKDATVIYLNYDGDCGQIYPHEPMIGLRLDGDSEEHAFWIEELNVKSEEVA